MISKIGKGLSASLAALMIMAAFAGCGGDSGNESGQTASTGSTGTTATGGTGIFEGFKADPGEVNFGGKEVVIASYGDIEPKDDGTEASKKVLKRVQMAEEKFNCKFVYKLMPDAETYSSAAAAGINYADIVHSPTLWSFPSWIKNEFYRPLDDVIDYSSEKYKPQDAISKWVNGKHYFLVDGEKNYPLVVIYNPDILEREGCEDPVTMMQEGRWNWDALETIAKKCTKTSGAQKQYGLTGWFVPYLLQANGVRTVKVGDNALATDLFENSSLNALTFYRKLLVEDKVVNPAGWEVGFDNFTQGQDAMRIAELYTIANLRDKMSNFKVVPMPMGPDVEGYCTIASNIAIAGVSATSEYDTADLMALWVYRNGTGFKDDAETYIDPYKNFVEGAETNKYFSSDEELELYWDTWQNSTSYFAPEMDANIMWTYITSNDSKIALGESPSTVLESMKNEVNAALENMMK